jgi:hypothetical protein
MNAKRNRGLAGALALSALLALPHEAFANTVQEDPSALAMVGDAVIARPLGLAFTVVGAAAYIVTLPFSWATGTARSAGKTLVVGPAKATFFRCLGCTQTGYHSGNGSAAE